MTYSFPRGPRTARSAQTYASIDNAAGRGTAISKAIEIVDCGLKASVNTEVGGEVAQSLVATYELITRNLLLANLNADLARLEAAEKALSEIADAWRSAVDVPKAAAVAS